MIVCQQKTDLKQPTLPCSLGLKTVCFSSDNVAFWNSCIPQRFIQKRVAFLIDISDLLLRRLFGSDVYYFGGARSKGFATLRNVSKLQFFDKIGQAKSVGFRFYSAIWRSESRISPRYLEITSISLIYSLTFSRKKEFFFDFPGVWTDSPVWSASDQRRL